MGTIWKIAQDQKWLPTELNSAANLCRDSGEFVANTPVVAQSAEVMLLPGSVNARHAAWMLLASVDSAVRINDVLLDNGIRVLADRDAIRIGDQAAMYFSTEQLARIEPYPGDEEVFCARCKTAIGNGADAVCCVRCGVWHHQQESEGKGCWEYSETCTLCAQPTNLDSAGYNWTPGEL